MQVKTSSENRFC